jgi:uncharacterized protein (TIGR04255 family)
VLYQRNPLAEVICQLQFPTVLQIATELPSAFQQRIRESYPVFRQETGTPDIPPGMSQLLANLPVNLQSGPIYFFDNEAGTRTVTLTRDAVALTERGYTRWEDLGTEIETVRSALEEIYVPSFYTRVGLRYQNILDPTPLGLQGAAWSQLLHPAIAGMLGVSDEITGDVTGLGGATEITISDLPDAAVRIQYGLVQAPPDRPAPFALDADFYTNQRSPFDQIPDILGTFNQLAGNLFRWAITERLRDALRPAPLAQ